jgi:hypothetical protein
METESWNVRIWHVYRKANKVADYLGCEQSTLEVHVQSCSFRSHFDL